MVTSKTLQDTNDFLSSVVKKENKPSMIESAYYFLALDFGLTLEKLDSLPIPYIINLLNTRNYYNTEEEKAHKKAMKKK